jgi:hypothetical protein
MAMLYLLINIYSQTCLSAHMHMFLRQEAAADGDLISVSIADAYVRDRYRREAESVSMDVNEGKRFASRYLEAERTKKYFAGVLGRAEGYSRTYYGRSYIIDEAKIARALDIADGAV